MDKVNPNLLNMIIYQVYVRNYSEAGTFQAVVDSLPRIRNLGVDMIYLLPIHPIGEKNRKGSLGSPYSIRDYLEINPELGNINDFQQLIEKCHDLDMKLMLDIVFNHTACDSRLLMEHPGWFYHDSVGSIGNRVGDWWDVVDLDFTLDRALWDELVEYLLAFVDMGVDGFRCDVASLIPLEFWRYARKAVTKRDKNVVWLSESVRGTFVKDMRDRGFACSSEAEMYQIFDMAYDYDTRPLLEAYFENRRPLRDYLEAILAQEWIYPGNYVKLRNLENHDTPRISECLGNDMDRIRNFTAFMFFQKGAIMLYNGQEFTARRHLSLFEKETIDKQSDISNFIAKLAKLKKQRIFVTGKYDVFFPDIDGVAHLVYSDGSLSIVGIFNLGKVSGRIKVDLPDGKYRNYLDGNLISVSNREIELIVDPVIIQLR